MDSVTRLRTALELGTPDRPPFTWWGHTFLEEWSPTKLADITIDRARRHGWDFVKLQPRASCFAEAFGSEYRASGNATESPALVSPAVKELDDFATLPEVDAGHPAFADQVEAIRLVAAGAGVPVIQTVFSPITVAGHLIGKDPQGIVAMLRSHPGIVGPALEKIGRALVSFSTASVEAGGAGVFYAVSGYASADLMTAEEYEALALPHDLEVIGKLPPADAAWLNILHLCGAHLHFGLAPLFGLPVVSWSVHDAGNPTLAEGRDRAQRTAMGGLGQKTTMVHARPEGVVAEGRAALEGTGGAGVILSAGCSVAVTAPEANLAAVREVVAA
ncbi:MAG TPA: uroporphyrinogen decarboxylase family protein [Actinomycetota bacterium]|nr:uroporphyrinogen decarboxylase family protein [Actinomycetota bacterium]